MTAAQEQLYLRTLRVLVAAGVPFVGLGTFALRQQYPALPRRRVADCDLQLPPDAAVLDQLTARLQAAGWQVTLWEEPVRRPLAATELAGKYYLRARQAGAVLDCSYENDYLSWPEFQPLTHWHAGLPLLRPAAIFHSRSALRSA